MAKITLIIRPKLDADRDVNLLRRYGVSAFASPSMTCIFKDVKLPDPADFCGVILTSRNAVDAVAKLDFVNSWKKMPAFVVGAASAAAAFNVGFSNIVVGTGGGRGLLKPIHQYITEITGKQDSLCLPFFWPSATEISFDIVTSLADYEISVKRLPVYQMTANKGLDVATKALLDNGSIASVVAMSPRSIRIFRENIDAIGNGLSLAGISLIAGSAAIADAAGDGWQNVYVARQPRRSRLLAIAVLLNQRCN